MNHRANKVNSAEKTSSIDFPAPRRDVYYFYQNVFRVYLLFRKKRASKWNCPSQREGTSIYVQLNSIKPRFGALWGALRQDGTHEATTAWKTTADVCGFSQNIRVERSPVTKTNPKLH